MIRIFIPSLFDKHQPPKNKVVLNKFLFFYLRGKIKDNVSLGKRKPPLFVLKRGRCSLFILI
jgi:hypothetical protein